jgi:integrase
VVLPGGGRLQPKRRFKILDEGKDWHANTSAELAEGTFTLPSDATVKQAIEAWLDGQGRA